MNPNTGIHRRFFINLLLLAVISVSLQAADYMSPGLTPEQVREKLGTDLAPLAVDVRSPVEFGVAHIPGAINVPVEELKDRLDELESKNGVLIYCINGSRTRQAEAVLMGEDIPNIYHLEGTFTAWIRGKYPVEKGGVKKSGW